MTLSLQVLDKTVMVKTRPEVTKAEWDVVGPRLLAFAEVVDHARNLFSDDQRSVFLLINNIVVFKVVQFDGFVMTRSFMDVKTGTFFWAVDDLASTGYVPPARIPTYYYHDAHHVRQWLTSDRAPDLPSRVRREVEATDQQIVVAQLLGNDAALVTHLLDYRSNPTAIADRLRTGVGLDGDIYEDHIPVLELDALPELLDPPPFET